MKSKSLQRWCVRSCLVLCLWAGGCYGELSELTPVPLVASSPLDDASPDESPLRSEESTLKEVATFAEEPVPNHDPLRVRETPEQAPAKVLTWDVMQKLRFATEGDDSVLFHFQMTNSSCEAVTIEKINTSCGCTTADTKALPFALLPGASENIQIRMSVVGKVGTVTKSIFVQSDHGNSTLLVTSELVPKALDESAKEPSNGERSSGTREQNLALAQADRQAVFQGSCVECHVRYAEERFGYELYLGACAICHDAKHRASMVPDLRAAGVPRDAAHWREHITDGVDDTLMPAFAKEQGGILSHEQIESLVKFLVETPLAPKALHR